MATAMEQDDMYDARFEFDAPRYYNFDALSPGSPADKWFDTAPDGPGNKPEKPGASNREPFKQLQDNTSNQQQPPGEPAAAAAAACGGDGAEAAPAGQQSKPKKVNIVTSWGAGAAAAAAAGGTSGAPKAAPRKSSVPAAAAAAAGAGGSRKSSVPAAAAAAGGGTRKSIVPAAAGGGTRKSFVPAAAGGAEPGNVAAPTTSSRPRSAHQLQGKGGPRRVSSSHVDSSKGADQQQVPRSEPPVTRSMSRLGMSLFSPVPENKAAKCGSPPVTRTRTAVKRFYTVQKTASTMTRTVKQPTSVQKLHQVLAPRVTKPTRSTKPLTLPDDFELQTTRRGQGRPAQQPEKSPFKPLAERVREFQFKTPPRFKSKPDKAATSKKRSPITKAEAPQLLTSARIRPRSCKSQKELEEEQMQQQFKARPVDTRVLSSSGQLGVPKVDKPTVTEPKPFNLRSDSRARVRCSHQQPSMQQAAAAAAAAAQFKAQPLNRSILDGPTFKPHHRERQGLTKAVSPELQTKKRALTGGASAEAEYRTRTRSHAEQHHHGGSGSLGAGAVAGGGGSSASLQPTQPQPFKLQTEARGALHEREMAAKVAAEEARAKRLRRVTAQPLPVTVDVPVLPAKPDPKPLTLPDPFPLKSLERHEEFEQQHRTRLQQEQEAARQAAEFKARPVVAGGPFVVHESDAPLTVPADPHLATDSRATERAEFDAHMAAKLQQEEEERRQQEELKRKQDEEAVRQYRKKLRFSARPMPSFEQPFFAQPSSKRLTKPQTPNFASKRLRKAG